LRQLQRVERDARHERSLPDAAGHFHVQRRVTGPLVSPYEPLRSRVPLVALAQVFSRRTTAKDRVYTPDEFTVWQQHLQMHRIRRLQLFLILVLQR
jgi:hypothetical protein